MTGTWVGTKRAERPTRAWYRWQWLTAAGAPDPAAVRMYDEVGPNLYRLACVLTDDAELAEQLVLQAIMASRHAPGSRQDLSTRVYVAWLAWGGAVRTTALDEAPEATLHQHIHGLTAEARAALGLCAYGGHTYRRAAELLGIAPDRVAQLLRDAMRQLGASPASVVGPTPAA